MKHVVARLAHEIPDRPPLRLVVDELVQVGERDDEWPAFVFVTASSGTGWVPARHLSADAGSAIVITAYDTTELPTRIDDHLEVIFEDLESGWLWCRAVSGRKGWVPAKTVEEVLA